MENSTTPLLSAKFDSSVEQVAVSLDQNLNLTSISLDEMIEQNLVGFGVAQMIQAILVSLLLVFDSQQTFISVYTDAEPTWHCTNSSTTCSSSTDLCSLSKSEWAWDGPSDKTIISNWSLECSSSSILTGLPSSCFFIGSLLGGLVLATLGDSSLGRKKLLFLSCFGMSIASFITIFSNNIWVYSSLRFVTGFFRSPIMSSALVMLMEMVAKRWRGQVVIIGFTFFSLGLLLLPAIAYIERGSSWRTLYVWTSIPAILCCIVAYPFVNESPRWLFMHGHEAEAVAVLKRCTSSLKHDSLNSCLLHIPPKNQVPKLDLYSFLKDLFKRNWALRRLLAITALGFGIGLVYYGLLLGVGNLSFDIYLSLTFNALLDIPAYFLTFILIEKWKRTSSIITFSIISGICSAICAAIGHDQGQEVLQVVLELASFFSVCVAFNVLYVFAAELFPTCVRNSTTSVVRQSTNLGAVFSPMLISASRQNDFLSFGLFGFVVFCCSFFVMFLPETRGVTLSDTFDEQEIKDGSIILVS